MARGADRTARWRSRHDLGAPGRVLRNGRDGRGAPLQLHPVPRTRAGPLDGRTPPPVHRLPGVATCTSRSHASRSTTSFRPASTTPSRSRSGPSGCGARRFGWPTSWPWVRAWSRSRRPSTPRSTAADGCVASRRRTGRRSRPSRRARTGAEAARNPGTRDASFGRCRSRARREASRTRSVRSTP